MKKKEKVKMRPLLINVEKLAQWNSMLNHWKWPEDMPGKPVGFDKIPEYLQVESKDRGVLVTKYDIITPVRNLIENIIGRKECLKWRHLNNLNRTEEQFEKWWLKHHKEMEKAEKIREDDE